MKNIVLCLLFGFSLSFCFAQESTNASGGDASGSGGSVVYSIGQVVNTYVTGTNGNTNQGVQQPYEIYLMGRSEEQVDLSVQVFPNPATDVLNVRFEEFQKHKATYQLVNMQGTLLQSGNITDRDTKLDLTSVAMGTYLLSISNTTTDLITFKIIKNQ